MIKPTFIVLALAVLAIEAAPQTTGFVLEGRVVKNENSAAIPDTLVMIGGIDGTPSPSSSLTTQIQALRARLNGVLPPNQLEDSVQNILKAAGSTSSSGRYVLTDAGGRFVFKDLPPGRYTVHAVRQGYFGPKIDGTYQASYSKSVELGSENPSISLDVRLAESAAITGRVSNARSPRTAVTAYRLNYINGKERWVSELTVTTSINGDFQLLGLAPGEVYVGAQGTYYRDVTQPELATKIVLKERETAKLDLNVQQTALTPRRVNGSALNPFGTPNSVGVIDFSVSNFLVAPQTPGLVDPPYTRYSNLLTPRDGRRTNGEFQIGPVPPGTYDLIAYWTEPTTQRTLIGKGMFQIVGSDVTGVSASIQPGATLSGEIRVQSTGADIRPETLSLTLESLGTVPTEFVTQPNPIAIDASGKFRGTNIPEERYALHLGPLPPTAYIEDIRIGDRSVFDDGYYLANGTGDVQILIRPEGQLVSGTVRKADGIPADTATVVLVPAVEKRKNAARYRAVHTDSNGVFRMLDVPPGEYTAYAWESVLPTAWMNAKFLEKHKERGRALTVTTGVAVELQMAVIPDVN